MKKILLILPLLILLVGCTNKIEENKIAYLEYKNELEETENFTEEKADFNTFFNIERTGEEIVNYSITIDKPTTDMYDVKALLIHDYSQEEAYPSSGIMDEPIDLLKGTEEKIQLKGTIQTIDNINDVHFKLFVEYKDEKGLENKVYYQVSRG